MPVARKKARLVIATLLWLAAVPASLLAQLDYRNLDDDRPTITEDAYPVERYAFEFLLPYSYERDRAGTDLHLVMPELEYGIVRNGQVGVKLPLAARRRSGDTEWGPAGVTAFGLYNLNTESRLLPAFAVRVDGHLPVGSLAGDGARVTFKAIATRSWGRNRVHLNAAWTVGDEERLAAVEPGHRWSYSAALDRTLFRQSLLLLGEIVTRRTAADTPVEVNAGIGVRYQLSPTMVMDLGLSRRIRRSTGPDFGVTAGFSRVFGLTWLMPARGRDGPGDRGD
ncbi:MAG TPA: transporter [Gemmatimonadales bacterium]|jgi:hypothetical protein|nr:transporter [Gemmatimonadales bacterium]